jgi:general secretion pathway protein A
MYERFYGLAERPFDLSPNPRFLFLSNGHKEALTHLQYGLTGRPGITVLVGEAGTGKTTLVRAALQSLQGASSQYVQISNPTLTREEFYEYLAAGFGFSDAAARSKTQFLRELGQSLSARDRENVVLALIVDEAQSIPDDLLEEIRLLTNLESATGRSLAVALVGQPELAARLNETRLRQLKQRIALRCELAPLDLKETAAYIAGRVRVAGGSASTMFTRDAVCAVYEYSHGIPRMISVICDNALVTGLAAETKPITRDFVREVCRDFQIGNPLPTPVQGQSPVRQSLIPGPESLRRAERGGATDQVLRGVPTPSPAVPGPETLANRTDGAKPEAPMFNGFGERRRFSFF